MNAVPNCILLFLCISHLRATYWQHDSSELVWTSSRCWGGKQTLVTESGPWQSCILCGGIWSGVSAPVFPLKSLMLKKRKEKLDSVILKSCSELLQTAASCLDCGQKKIAEMWERSVSSLRPLTCWLTSVATPLYTPNRQSSPDRGLVGYGRGHSWQWPSGMGSSW